jgi:hypothetical protein
MEGTAAGPLDLTIESRRYPERTDGILEEEEQRLLDRLNAVWKSIYASMEQFHVSATAGSVTYDPYRSSSSEDYKCTIHLKCILFTADLHLAYIRTESSSSSDGHFARHIHYKLDNVVMLHQPSRALPAGLDATKRVFESEPGHMIGPDHEAELMDAMFVPYDVLNSMRDLLIYNKMLIAVRGFRRSMTPSKANELREDVKEFIFKQYMKLAQESADALFRSLLLESRPQWVAPLRMEFIRQNTLANPRLVNPVYPFEGP